MHQILFSVLVMTHKYFLLRTTKLVNTIFEIVQETLITKEAANKIILICNETNTRFFGV